MGIYPINRKKHKEKFKKNYSSYSVNHPIMKDLITVIMVYDTVLEIMLFYAVKISMLSNYWFLK